MQTPEKYNKLFLIVSPILIGIFCIVYMYVDRIKIDMNTKVELPQWKSVSPSQWQTLSQKKILFAHMSVGNNILDGCNAVLGQYPELSLTITKTSNPDQMRLPGIYHELLGFNAEPARKVQSFGVLLNSVHTAAPDMVLMKFCYVDIYSDTDVGSLFKAYCQAISDLKTQMPNTLFLHCTVPLTSSPISFKKLVKETAKQILGRSNHVDDNLKRFQFNEMIRKTWPAEEVLDIARIEAATPEGFLCFNAKQGQKIPFLYKDYTTDGGHLNDVGSQRIGEQLLIFLANAAIRKSGIEN